MVGAVAFRVNGVQLSGSGFRAHGFVEGVEDRTRRDLRLKIMQGLQLRIRDLELWSNQCLQSLMSYGSGHRTLVSGFGIWGRSKKSGPQNS